MLCLQLEVTKVKKYYNLTVFSYSFWLLKSLNFFRYNIQALSAVSVSTCICLKKPAKKLPNKSSKLI